MEQVIIPNHRFVMMVSGLIPSVINSPRLPDEFHTGLTRLLELSRDLAGHK